MRIAILRAGVLGAVVGLTGCIIPFNGPGDIKRDIKSITGDDYNRTFGLTVGRSGMAFARWVVRRSGEEDIPIKGIHKVEIGIYEIREHTDRAEPAASLLAGHWPDWSPMVEMHEEGGSDVLILTQSQQGRLKRMLFVVEEEEELVIVRLTGKLDSLLEEAIAFALEESDRPELVEPAIEELREQGQDRPPDADEPASPEAPVAARGDGPAGSS
jgi:hypothetical protein